MYICICTWWIPALGVRSFRTKIILYNDHFVQKRPFGTITQKSLRTRIFLYEVGPEFLHTHADESFRTRNSKFLFFLYVMVSFLQNGLCTKWSLYEVTPVFLYEVVSYVRSGLSKKWLSKFYIACSGYCYIACMGHNIPPGVFYP